MSESGSETEARRAALRPRLEPWLAPALFLCAAAGETIAMLLMTVYRYRSQNLVPALFDLTKTANLLGLLLEAPFILLFLLLLLLRRFHRLPMAVPAATFSLVSLITLYVAPSFVGTEGGTGYTGYLIFLGVKALELGVFVVMLRRPRRRWWRIAISSVLAAIGIVIVVLISAIATVLASPFGSSVTDQPRQEYDAGVILGAAVWSGDKPSPVLRERINRGYDLLTSESVQFLVLTGGRAPNELPEAEVARRELLKRGADPTRIVLETHTSSTLEQILYIRDQLQKKQGWHSFIIISDQFHLKRALEICQFNDIEAVGVSSESPLGPQNLALYHLRESGALILYWLFGA